MLNHSLRFSIVRPWNVFRILGILMLFGLLCWIALATPSATIAATQAPGHAQITQPAMLGLSNFTVKATKKHTAQICWETGSEMLILGFNVWKRAGKGEWKQLNAEMIPAKNIGEVIGNSYAMTDKQVKIGKSYSYQLEVIGSNGVSAFTDPITVKIK